ncbi:conserved lipoLppL domain protein [Mycobacterium ulcerans str. Harvey]|uniref:Conserved lipoLppL domain protein n=1 Tax=Mycobacterium ulcerans str. Harvey TaxID=1299332 RepID=A0ABN0QYE0_MYCUL|nr:conserved lipoLppL domain protein [Mycobacterium ulcerans str. Harvey]
MLTLLTLLTGCSSGPLQSVPPTIEPARRPCLRRFLSLRQVWFGRWAASAGGGV